MWALYDLLVVVQLLLLLSYWQSQLRAAPKPVAKRE